MVLAVSLPLAPYAAGELNSIVDVLQRSFAVAIEDNERRSRALADVVLEPDIKGFSAGDYLKTPEVAARGYEVLSELNGLVAPRGCQYRSMGSVAPAHSADDCQYP